MITERTLADHCIYCRKSDDWTDDHVLSEWTGCRAKLKDAVCGTCNSQFGSGPEARLYTLLIPIAEVCAVPQGELERRGRVWKAEIHGQERRLVVSADRRAAELTQPVVQKSPMADGRTLLTVTGSEKQDKEVRDSFLGKGLPVASVASRDYPGDFVGSFEVDFDAVYADGALTAAAKYAANYAWFASGRTSTSLAFAGNAYRALKDVEDPSRFVFPVGDDELLNKLILRPPHHTCLVTPSDRTGTWVAVVVLFGLIPFFVLASDVGTKLEYWKCHRFLVGKGEPTVEECKIVGRPNIRLANVPVENAKARYQRLRFIGENYKEHLPEIVKALTGREITMERSRERNS